MAADHEARLLDWKEETARIAPYLCRHDQGGLLHLVGTEEAAVSYFLEMVQGITEGAGHTYIHLASSIRTARQWYDRWYFEGTGEGVAPFSI